MTNLQEIWKPLPGFETKYLISSFGRVKGIKTGTIRKPMVVASYNYIGLSTENRQSKSFRLHRLVAKAFIPNPDNHSQVNHIDGNKLNNRVENLEWCTHAENTKHRDENNLNPKGEQLKRSKLTETDVVKIRELRASGMTYDEIVPLFSVNKSVICAVCLRKAWAHVA